MDFLEQYIQIQIKTCCPCSSHKGKEEINFLLCKWLAQASASSQSPAAVPWAPACWKAPHTHALGKLPTEGNYGREGMTTFFLLIPAPNPRPLATISAKTRQQKNKRGDIFASYMNSPQSESE